VNEQKTILITGASRGIGRNIAVTFAKHGYRVFINFLKEEKEALITKETADKFTQGSEIIKADVSDYKQVQQMVKYISQKAGKLDVLINNAGVTENSLIIKMKDSQWDDVIKTNLYGPFYTIKECGRLMAKKKAGSIINISSLAGVKGAFGGANYASSKGALIALTKSCAIELGRFNICVNVVFPGFHMTDMGQNSGERYAQNALKESVLNKTTDINELTEFIVMLSETKTVSGQVFNWDSRII
jgi:3-oxoacyl-[acyl-carrier protein] reductase